MDNSSLIDLVNVFCADDSEVSFITYKEELCCSVMELGRALGYGDNGRCLTTMLRREWKEEFQPGKHFIHLTGKNLKDYKELIDEVESDSTSSDYLKSNKVMLLLEAGIDKVLLKTEKPIGVKIREWLASEVMPSIRKTGKYGEKKQEDVEFSPEKEQEIVAGYIDSFNTAVDFYHKLGGADSQEAWMLRDCMYLTLSKAARNLRKEDFTIGGWRR